MLFYMKMNKLDKNKLKLTINTRIKTKKKMKRIKMNSNC